MSNILTNIIHDCLDVLKGSGIPCQSCSVPKKGNCQVMLNILKGIIYGTNAKTSLRGLPREDIKDIISNIIAAIQKGNYRGHTDAQFATWIRKICYGKKADHFRKEYKLPKLNTGEMECPAGTDTTTTEEDTPAVEEMQTEEALYAEDASNGEEKQSTISNPAIWDNLPDLKQQENKDKIEEDDIKNFLAMLKKAVSHGTIKAKDINFIQVLYDGLKGELTQEDIAIAMGVKPNTFNQELARLREKLHKKGISFGHD